MLKIGHRGAMGYEPENTLRSFKKALDIGVDAIEFDVYVCKTGEMVVVHDDTVERTTNGREFVVKMTFDELRALDAGKGEQIPRLEEVLDLVNRKCKVNIELKGPNTAEPTLKVVSEYIKNHGWQESDFKLSSFDHQQVKRVKELNKTIMTGTLWIGKPVAGISIKSIQFTKNLGANFIGPNIRYTTQKLVDKAHELGLHVYVWTIKSREDAERMKALGVDGIFCNYPDQI